ncbi:replication restart DNA helicase PriA [Marinobacter daqiaonensis]|uniref:Replication restart protein PriA n=1 Tax=Marinobacter daqiaonensis TaxID=650891 RepID=A0A1I6K3L5_9GAMM|nr:primosomal protein N' [Marinobacter daqiaonensis]SFR85766.1 replication restart DNA helicase PriA [Marinobacter daqiaonensis]
MSQTVRVALNRPIRRLFDYWVPEGRQLCPGQRLRVPFGPRSAIGLVVETGVTPPPGLELKPAGAALENWPALPPETLELLSWAASYYQHPLGECLFMALPPALRRGQPAELTAPESFWQLIDVSGSTNLPANAHRQRELMEQLRLAEGPVPWSQLRQQGYTKAQLHSLGQKGLVRAAEKPAVNQLPSTTESNLPPLTGAQQEAFRALPQECGFSATLLYGITGSGKTELYLHYLQDRLEDAGQALVLVPEINLTPQTVARFRRYFGGRIVVWHSALNDRERLETWLRVRNGEPVILIGTRSAVLLPFTRLQAIIVDEEHDSSYKQGEGFRYSARDMAVFRAQRNHCPVILGSATPSLESLHNARTGKYTRVDLTERAGNATEPTISLLDIRSRPLEGGLSRPAIQAIGAALEARQQVLIYINRRGYSPVLMCFDCGHIAECPHCDTRLTYHRRDRALRCHHCDYQQPAFRHCPKCDSEACHPVGQGTERAEEVLATAFPATPVLRIDRDSTQRKGSIQSIISQVNEGNPCILVGTQMVAKGHDFHNITLVVVINADGGLFSVDFRAPEQMVQTLLQVSGRAGRGSLPGKVLIQTCHSDHPLLQSLAGGNYLAMAKQLLTERQESALPPFRAMAIVRAEAPSMEEALGFLDQIRQQLTDDAVEIWGPLPAALARKADRHRAQLILQADRRGHLNRVVSRLCADLDSRRLPTSLRWIIDIDPLETS